MKRDLPPRKVYLVVEICQIIDKRRNSGTWADQETLVDQIQRRRAQVSDRSL
jgi:hypothetical protein